MMSKTRPIILIFVDWFFPGYLAGGPIQSVVSLINYLNEDFDFRVFTTNQDLNAKTPYPGIIPNQWIDSDLNCKVYYADPSALNRKLIRQILKETNHQAVYFNSLFSKYFSVVPLLILNKEFPKTPVILAPRGMLGAGALSIKKNKKSLFIFLVRLFKLLSTITWHATSQEEREEIIDVFGKKTIIKTIPNLPKQFLNSGKKQKFTGKLKLFFSSRISSKKNLTFALDVLKEIRSAEVSFHVYGLIEDSVYWQKCSDQIAKLPPNIKVVYKGTFRPEEASGVYASEEVLFLPTLNENYGHSIVESLLCGCPVVISDQTPWKDLQDHGAGFALPLSQKDAFVEAIQVLANMNEYEFQASSRKAIEYIRNKINVKDTVFQYKKMFHEQIKN